MSKIYEALRQAEIDRANQNGQPTAPEPATSREVWTEPSRVAVLDPLPLEAVEPPQQVILPPQVAIPGLQIPSAVPAEPIPVPAAQIDELAAAPMDPPGLDLTGVRACLWTPSFDQMPALHERGSAVEQFRSLRSRMFEFRDLNNLKSILVSSGLPQEGKSFVATNLAVAFSRHKASRVLLIDGDMRRATLHKLLGTSQGPGLTEYLSGKANLSEIMQRPSITDMDNPLSAGLASLTFIPGGMMQSKAADLSGNHKFDRLIESVAPFFDWIVVDSSPVNLVSDGVNLARACDAVLLVARGAVTRYETAQRALAELKASKVLGFVLNAVDEPSAAGGYYGYDGYDPYYSPAESEPKSEDSNVR
jgi:protein-tyrosine kinase